jgi:hypothetical protein
VIYRGLCTGAQLVDAGERDAGRIHRVVGNVLTTEPLLRLEYVEVVGSDDLVSVERVEADALVAVAARVGDVRLIDNMTIRVDATGASVDLGVKPGVARDADGPGGVARIDRRGSGGVPRIDLSGGGGAACAAR